MKKLTRRDFLKTSALTTVMAVGGPLLSCSRSPAVRRVAGKKVIVIGFDGMDPLLCMRLMEQGKLPNLASLRKAGGFRRLATSIPPQSPVAWANFINGAGPGSHGIFDFIHRDPERQAYPFFAAAETLPGLGYLELGQYKIQLDFWPFNHKPPATVLRRAGIPFWDFLDQAGIPSTFYDLPSNYPPSPSKHGNHRCLSGMGTPDLLGTYGTYQYFSEDCAQNQITEGGGKRFRVRFDGDASEPLTILGPENTFLKDPRPSSVPFRVYRDAHARAALIEIADQKILLKQGEWSSWIKVSFPLDTPALLPEKKIPGIIRMYLKEVTPVFKLYVSPVNADPSDPAIRITTPPDFIRSIAKQLGPFYTTGFQEDHKALSNKVFNDDEFAHQADYVLQERLALLDYALKNYDDGLLFFYFSSTDLQSHMFWWDTPARHPYRSQGEAQKYFTRIHDLYSKMDAVVGDLLKRYGDRAHLIIMSDHGFANFRRQFNINTWLRDNGYLAPHECTSVLGDVDWRKSRAYALGINSLYLNLKGREKYGIVDPSKEREQILDELIQKLETIRDSDGKKIIRSVYRSDKVYQGEALTYAPDLIIGYNRDYRCSWKACLGDITPEVLLDNDSAWAADHCMDPAEIPGVLFSNRQITEDSPALSDIGPSILTAFGIPVPSCMTGHNVFKL